LKDGASVAMNMRRYANQFERRFGRDDEHERRVDHPAVSYPLKLKKGANTITVLFLAGVPLPSEMNIMRVGFSDLGGSPLGCIDNNLTKK
jgi:hypothetical protein